MIELTPEQSQSLAAAGPTEALDPATNEAYVLLRKADYDRLAREEGYEYGPMTDEERGVLIAEMDALLDDDLATEDGS